MTDKAAINSAPSNPSVWILTDGKIGDDVQCLAVAAALGAGFEKRVVRPREPWSWVSQYGLIDPQHRRGAPESPLNGALPDIVIASGRRSIAYARAVKQASDGRAIIVFLKDPRIGRSTADIIWAPAHDRVTAPNAFSTLTSPHGLSDKINEKRGRPSKVIATLPRPLLGVVLGGGAGYTPDEAQRLAVRLETAASRFGAVAIAPSRRTPDEFLKALRAKLEIDPIYFWQGEGENPYIDILANADALIVGADSHNMMSEAAATGAGLYAWRPKGLVRKLDWFVGQLEEMGVARAFSDSAEPFSKKPIDATQEIVAEIEKRLNLRRA